MGQTIELFAKLPETFRKLFDPNCPWDLLGKALDEALAGLPSSDLSSTPPPDAFLRGDRIRIGKGVSIGPSAVIEGPVHIGDDVTIRAGAIVRGGCWIEDRAVVGANTEVKHSIFLSGAKAPHLNYVGDSILGAEVNLGAGTVLSNFRHDGGTISIPRQGEMLATGRRKLGAVLGDGVQTGCNAVLHPGCIVGAGTNIYPGVQLRSGFYSARSIVKLVQQIEVVTKS